jgi:hypothetical protein
MSWWFVSYGCAGVAVLYVFVDRHVLQPRRDRAQYGADWEAYNLAAFTPQVVRGAASGAPQIRRRVGVELRSTGGRVAVRMASASGIVVHEFNRDGSFSARGPYFVKLRPCVWGETGERHLVDVQLGLVYTSNPNGGEAKERGIQIVELATPRHAPVPLRDYAAAARTVDRLRSEVGRPAPDLGKYGVTPSSLERWGRVLDRPFGRFSWVPIVLAVLAGGLYAERDFERDVAMRSLERGRPAPVDPISWSSVLLFGVLMAPVFGLAAGLTIPPLARRGIVVVIPAARRVWAYRQEAECQEAARERLAKMSVSTSHVVASRLRAASSGGSAR